MDIDKLIKLATLEKNGAAKEAFRAIKAELLLNSSSKNPKSEGKEIFSISLCPKREGDWSVIINELDLSIIRKLIKEREEQVSMYDANSRKDLADMYREQMRYLKGFLPPEISENKIEEFVVSSYPNGYPKKELGKVIQETKRTYPTANTSIIAKICQKYCC